jgi:hypothetical protein
VKNIRQLFDRDNPADSFVIADDFVSSGRISGAKSIPIFRLKIGSFRMSGGQAVAGELISRAVSARTGLPSQHPLTRVALVLEPFYLEREFGL